MSLQQTGAGHRTMRELNRSLVLDVVKSRGPTSRSAIAKETALAKPTVSAIVEDLIEQGLVREIGPGETTTDGGRPPMLLEFNARSQFVAGVQLGVRRTTVVVADAVGIELARVEHATPRGGPEEVLSKVAATVRRALVTADAAPRRLAAVGICVPGLVDLATGRCLLAPNLGWQDVAVSELLSGMLKAPVFAHNTAQAAAAAESVEGAGHGVDDLVFLYVGTGVGAGILTKGRLYHGTAGIAGEIGHCRVPGAAEKCNCGGLGCLETVASGPAMVRTVEIALDSGRDSALAAVARREALRPEHVIAAAEEGDGLALEVLERAGTDLGTAASWLINLFNPEVLVVGGSMAAAGEALIGPLRDAALDLAVPQAAARVRIECSTVERDAEVRGAVLLALQGSETYYRLVFQGG